MTTRLSIGKRIIGLFAAALVFSTLTTGVASAQTPDLDTNQLESIVTRYGKKIENSYSGVQMRFNDKEDQLAQKNGIDSTSYKESGLSLKDVSTTTKLIGTQKTDSGYRVLSEITTKMVLVPEAGTTITIAGENRNHLDSSATDLHSISIALTKGNDADGYTVVGDEIQYPDEQNDETPDMINVPQSVPNSAETRESSDPFANRAGLNYIKMSKYAEKWTEDAPGNKMNPDFPIYDEKNGNCANFASQAIYAGGLKTTFGNSLQIWDDHVWTWNLAGIAKASHTWSTAQHNYNYMKDSSGAFTKENSPWRVGQGGLIYGDWDNDGSFNHVMVVVGYINDGYNSTPVICQKSAPRHDYPFRDSVKNAPKTTRWAGLQWKAEW